MENNRVTILGGGESGVGAALLAMDKGYQVWLSDFGSISSIHKQEIEENDIAYEEGGHSVEKILKSGLIIKSPGISDKAPIVVEAQSNNIPVISEIEFASRFVNKPLIAITGSNGKTTTTLLIHHLLTAAGKNAALCGNIGSSLARHVLADEAELFVVEVSSFQLDGTVDFCPDTAVLLNITPDHLDRYDYDFEKYAQSKMSIARNMKSGHIVYNLQDNELSNRVNQLPAGNLISTFSLNKDTPSRINDEILNINFKDKKCELAKRDIELKGEHNQMNLMAAILVAMEYGVKPEDIQANLSGFKNHPNRLEFIARINGVDFINDSKATNVESVYYALGSFDQPIIWIAGGQDKGNDYTQIEQLVQKKVKSLVCLGLDNKKLIDFFQDSVDTIVETNNTDDAVRLAFDLALPNDVVLLSPACASFDIFDNYAQRGDFFKKSVLKFKELAV
jgi:UDP-N-acetylmuramoylalanine--D-glutamate ligase